MIGEAEGLLISGSRAGTFGRYLCEAAIQSVHAARAITGRINHDALGSLYALLASRSPSVGVLVGQAAAMVDAGEPNKARAVLGRLDASEVRSYQPYWVALANALAASGETGAARQALQTAMGLTEDVAIRSFLAQSLGSGSSMQALLPGR
jgi:RNA polymerase sigma-70 factor (ECF subfamily)